jgi:hypothetical protein
VTKRCLGRLAFRVEGDWWVGYYAMPDTMEGALEMGRVRMTVIINHPQRKHAFMKLLQGFVQETIPEFEIAEARPAVIPAASCANGVCSNSERKIVADDRGSVPQRQLLVTQVYYDGRWFKHSTVNHEVQSK